MVAKSFLTAVLVFSLSSTLAYSAEQKVNITKDLASITVMDNGKNM